MTSARRVSSYMVLGALLLASHAMATEFACADSPASDCVRAWIATKSLPADVEIRVGLLSGNDAPARAIMPLRRDIAPRLPVTVVRADGTRTDAWFSVAILRQVAVWGENGRAGETAMRARPASARRDVTGIADTIDGGTNAPPGSATPSTLPMLASATLRRSVRAGDIVVRDDLRLPGDIVAGDRVRYAVGDARVRITGSGRALADGAVGQRLRILPEHGSQPIEAVATGTP